MPIKSSDEERVINPKEQRTRNGTPYAALADAVSETVMQASQGDPVEALVILTMSASSIIAGVARDYPPKSDNPEVTTDHVVSELYRMCDVNLRSVTTSLLTEEKPDITKL